MDARIIKYIFLLKNGNLANIKWLKASECPWDTYAFCYAAKNGNLETMKRLRQNELSFINYD